MWNTVSMPNVRCENTRVPVQMKPSIKCNDADVNGGVGRLSVCGSPGVGLTVHCGSWVLKYGQRETKWWEEKTVVTLLWFVDENKPVRAMHVRVEAGAPHEDEVLA